MFDPKPNWDSNILSGSPLTEPVIDNSPKDENPASKSKVSLRLVKPRKSSPEETISQITKHIETYDALPLNYHFHSEYNATLAMLVAIDYNKENGTEFNFAYKATKETENKFGFDRQAVTDFLNFKKQQNLSNQAIAHFKNNIREASFTPESASEGNKGEQTFIGGKISTIYKRKKAYARKKVGNLVQKYKQLAEKVFSHAIKRADSNGEIQFTTPQDSTSPLAAKFFQDFVGKSAARYNDSHGTDFKVIFKQTSSPFEAAIASTTRPSDLQEVEITQDRVQPSSGNIQPNIATQTPQQSSNHSIDLSTKELSEARHEPEISLSQQDLLIIRQNVLRFTKMADENGVIKANFLDKNVRTWANIALTEINEAFTKGSTRQHTPLRFSQEHSSSSFKAGMAWREASAQSNDINLPILNTKVEPKQSKPKLTT